MDSSTSLFDRWPRLAALLLLCALLAWAAGALYTVRWNPEIQFLRHCAAVKEQWADKLEREHAQKFVLCGGSSTLTSIQGERLLSRQGLPVLNLGLHADMGARLLAQYALTHLRPRDTLIVAFEPDLLDGAVGFDSLGVQFSLATGRPEMLRSPDSVDWLSALLDMRPGGYHAFTMAGKILLQRPLYRYFTEEIDPSGWQKVGDRRAFDELAMPPSQLSAEARQWLEALRSFGEQRQCRVAYSLPWVYSRPENAAQVRQLHLQFLTQIASIFPVLKEPELGVHTVREHFADTRSHLTSEGAALRSDALAQALKDWRLWSPEELQQLSAKRTEAQARN